MNYSWRCLNCDVHVEITRPMADSAVPPDDDIDCLCNLKDLLSAFDDEGEAWAEWRGRWKRVYQMPGLTKASYLDGQRKFTDFREANKLQREAIKGASQEKKDEIAAEIRRMGVRVGKTSQ